DVAFRVGELKDSRLIARRIGTAHRVTLAAPPYLAKHGEPQHPHDLLQHQCLVYTGLAANINEWVFREQGKPDVVVRVNGQFQSNSSEAIRQAACEGLGIVCSPLWIYGEDIRAGRLKPILARFQPPSLPLNVVFQPARRPSLKVNSFVSYFTEAFSRDPDIATMLAEPSPA